jgi:hypothetical protein
VKRYFFLAGFAGLLSGAVIYAGASALSTRLPILAQGFIPAAITFACLLLLSLIEIPLILFGLRQMARSATPPRRLIIVTFAVYVMFASVYASFFVLLTGQIVWGIALAALCLVRFASGVLIR